MKKPKEGYELIVVESYHESGSGLHGDVHVRPVPGQGLFKSNYRVEGSKKAMMDPSVNKVGTKFRIWAKVTDREGTPFVYTNYNWPVEIVK